MKKSLLNPVIFATILLFLYQANLLAESTVDKHIDADGAKEKTPTLAQQFAALPRDAKPYTNWKWLGSVNPPETITRELEEFSAKGIELMSLHSAIKPKDLKTPELTGQKYEAENGKLGGCEIAGEVGVRYVKGINENDYIEWENIKVPKSGYYKLSFRYACAKTTYAILYINGVDVERLYFPSTSSGTSGWDVKPVIVKLNKGKNSIKYLANERATTAANLDAISLVKMEEKDINPGGFSGIASFVNPAVKNGGFRMAGYNLWCPSIIKVGDTYHMFASRWPYTPPSLSGWLKQSEIVRATSKNLYGPYNFEEVVIPANPRMVHNPKILKHKDKYIIVYMTGGKKEGYAYSDKIAGPWTIVNAAFGLKNPTMLIHEDGSSYVFGIDKKSLPKGEKCPNGHTYTLYAKAYTAPELTGTYSILPGVTLKNDGGFIPPKPDPNFAYEMEDPHVWWANNQYNMVCLDWDGWATGHVKGGAQYYSTDGVNYKLVSILPAHKMECNYDDGTMYRYSRRERPFVYVENEVALAYITAGIGFNSPVDDGPCHIIINPVDNYFPCKKGKK